MKTYESVEHDQGVKIICKDIGRVRDVVIIYDINIANKLLEIYNTNNDLHKYD